MRTRKDVWKLVSDPADKTLHWYGVAVQQMQGRMFDDPTSWKFQAAMHGYDANLYPPMRPGEKLPSSATQKKYWDHCQHASWFFLPWHRIYIYLFEQLCRAVIAAKGGPQDWSLPYWDYSHAQNAQQRTLPTPFRAQTLAGAANPLFVDRRAGVNSGNPVGSDQQSEDTTCMKSKIFSGMFPNGFAGGKSAAMQFSHYTGSCENVPHNTMHDAIGGSTGWMGDPMTAALDPIFWLHHSNIDRLWVIWLADPSHALPTDTKWTNHKFDFFDSKGVGKRYAVKDVLQTTGPLCDYVYADTTSPLAAAAVVTTTTTTTASRESLAMKAMRKSKLIGASKETQVTLGPGATSVTFAVHTPAAIEEVGEQAMAVTEAGTPTRRIHLALENVTATSKPVHTYEVYVNVPEGDAPDKHPELFAGLIPRFGLVEASRSDQEHAGQGLNLSFDITHIVSALQNAGKWDPKNVRITFAPHDVHEDEALKAEGKRIPERKPVKVGRISLYTHQEP